MKSFAAIGVLALTANALIKEDRLPLKTSSISVDKSQYDHTTDIYGGFVHPFRQEAPEVQTIHYPESKTFSKKLHRRAGHSKYTKSGQAQQRAINRDVMTQRSKPKGIWDMISESLFPAYGVTYTQQPTKNYNNLLYVSEIHLGTPMQEMWVIWDTGSESLLVQSDLCTACTANTFKTGDSTSFAFLEPAEYDSVTYMDGTSISGQLGTDRACPVSDEASCVPSFQFTSISQNNGLSDREEGIIGQWSGNISGYDDVKLIMPQLSEAGAVDDTIFSWFMTDTEGDTYIDFGAPNEAAMSSVDDLIYIDVIDEDYWWTNYVTGIRWKGDSDTTEYALTSKKALTDTGSSCIIVPTDEYNVILGKLSALVPDWNGEQYVFSCEAKNTLPSFELLYGGYWFEVTPDDYLILEYEENNTCSFCLSRDSGSEWILGDAFMRGWYSIHDHDQMRMGFVPFSGSPKSKAE